MNYARSSRKPFSRSKNSLILDNVMKGQIAYSFQPQEEIQDVSKPVQAWPLVDNIAAEEMGKIRQICEPGNKTFACKSNK